QGAVEAALRARSFEARLGPQFAVGDRPGCDDGQEPARVAAHLVRLAALLPQDLLQPLDGAEHRAPVGELAVEDLVRVHGRQIVLQPPDEIRALAEAPLAGAL